MAVAVITLLLLAPVAVAATHVLNFDGLQDGETVANYYNGGLGGFGSGPGPNFGVVFLPSTSLVQAVPTLGPPSLPNALVRGFGESETRFTVAAGFTSLSFYFLNPGGPFARVTVFDSSGHQLAEVDLFATQVWSQITVPFTGTATEVVLEGDHIYFDDLTIGQVGPTLGWDSPFQTRYAANLHLGESYISLLNTGANGSSILGPGLGGAVGNICVNVYAFDSNEEMISCCSCLLTPNQVNNLGVNRDITSNTATGVMPTSVTIKLLATLAGANGTGTSCTNAAAGAGTAAIVGGYTAYGTTLHATPTAGAFATTETPFTPAMLSPGELAHLSNTCSNLIGNLSGFGICASCRNGALGAQKM